MQVISICYKCGYAENGNALAKNSKHVQCPECDSYGKWRGRLVERVWAGLWYKPWTWLDFEWMSY